MLKKMKTRIYAAPAFKGLRLGVVTSRSNFSIFSPLCNKLSYLPFYEVLNTTLYFPCSVTTSVILTKA